MNLSSRIRGHAPQLTTLMLCALAAGEIVRGALMLRGEHAERAERAVPPAPRGTSMTLDTQHIVSAHLFGVMEAATPIRELRAANANLRLDGTLATEDPRRGLAIIHDGQSPKFYAVGGMIDGASLERVYRDHVVLSRAGVLEILKLPRLTGSPQRGMLAAAADTAPAARGYFVDSQGRAVDTPPGKFDGIIRTIQTMDPQSGKMRGFVVYPVGSGAPLHLLGLSPADLITSINGTPLDDPKRAQQILAQLQSSDSANVTIERQNQKMELVLNVAAATEKAPAAVTEEP